jgi:short-subunit dehydrogenase
MKTISHNAITHRPLSRKTVVITGASSGVGKAAALEFASLGATLVLAARRGEALQEVADECESFGAAAIAVETDVTKAEEVKHLALRANEVGGKIDVWINNAGVLAAGGFAETPVEVHEQVIQTNLIGYINGAHAVLPYFKKQGYGVLINNISIGGLVPTPYAAGYTASKFGLRGFSESLKGELTALRDIHVCDLYPAFLDTPGMQHAGNYTGKVLKPAPPIFNPQRVVRAMVSLAQNPKSRTTTDLAAPFLKMAYAFFPGLTRRISASIIRGYLKSADAILSTDGNLFKPVQYGTSVYGGWNNRSGQKINVAAASVFLTGLAAGLLIFGAKKV